MSRYDIEKFDPPPDPDLVCCICQCVLDKAVECPCRHVFCQSCIERWLTNRHTCPTCRKRTRKQDLKPVLPLVQNMLNRLLMICDFRNNGCIEKIMLEHFDRHVKNCGYEMKICKFSKCGSNILRMHLEEHENAECEHRESACEGECGLMIALSDRPSHNCVAALKAHIDEKNKMIEQLKVKLHELNNLSQSLNDQLVELRQQLNDRNQVNDILISDSSDTSDSYVSDFMSDDLSRDSWFDSDGDGIVYAEHNAESATNNANNADQENNNNNNNSAPEGSDVVEQVERTVVNSLFELSSRLERVRNQMRAVLNSSLVQDQNSLNDEVRIPSAAELDAIVNNTTANNDNNNNSEATTRAANNSSNDRYNNNDNTAARNDPVNENAYESHDERTIDSPGSENHYYTEDDDHSVDRYSNDGSHASDCNGGNREHTGADTDGSDLNWISDYDSSHTPYNQSPHASSPATENRPSGAFSSFRDESGSDYNRPVPDHIILSQPPDSPSDTTGSFSSIPSTSSVANSPVRDHDNDDSLNGSVFTSSPRSNKQSSPAHSDRSYFGTSDANLNSPKTSSFHSTPRSQERDGSDAHSVESIMSSSPARSFTSEFSEADRDDQKSERAHYSTNENTVSSFASISSAEHSEHDESAYELSPYSSPLRELEAISETDKKDNNEKGKGKESDAGTANEYYDENNCVDSSLDYGDEGSNENDNAHLTDTGAEDSDHHSIHEDSDASDDIDNSDSDRASLHSSVAKCEPDSTFSPLAIQQSSQSSTLDRANGPGLNTTISDSETSEESDSVRYLTKHVKRNEKAEDRSSDKPMDIHNRNMERNEFDAPASTMDSGFVTHTSSPVNSSDELNRPQGERKYASRKRKTVCNSNLSDNCKKSRYAGVNRSSYSQNVDTCVSGENYSGTDVDFSNFSSRYDFRNRAPNDSSGGDYNDGKKNKNFTHSSDGGMIQTRSRISPSRDKQSWRDNQQRFRKNRSCGNRRSTQTIVSNENNAQSLNVKIDLSLINYTGHIGNETTATGNPATTVVHNANISPISTVSTIKKDSGYTNTRAHLPERDRTLTQKQDDSTHRNNRPRSARSQRQEVHGSMRNTHSSPARGPNNSINTSTNNRDFPKSWRDASDSSSDNTWEPGSDCDEMDDTVTEGEEGYETDSSYEVQIPKSTAALLEEYASDETDESWTVGMN